MAESILDRLAELRRFFRGCGHPSYLDNCYADLLEADAQLDQEGWEEVTREVNDLLEANCEDKDVYYESVLVEDGKQCLAYRKVGDGCGASLTRYKKCACRGAQLLQDYHGIAPRDELLDKSSPHAWTYAVFYWLNLDSGLAHTLKAQSLDEVDLRWGDNEGPGMVEISRLVLPDTAIRSSVVAIDWLHQLLANPLREGSLEWDICRVLSDGKSRHRGAIQSELVNGDSSDGVTKTTLSALVKRQLLGKQPGRQGYFLTERGEIAFAAAR